MNFDAETFEKQIYRIHKLLEQPGSVVTWDDHFPDPDNPEQPRQVDITLKIESKLTLIECRIHRKAQDVNWIEELIGRRVSLRADLVIAVSASGFTIGATKKAEAFGIILRDFHSLTEEEIKSWGKTTRIHLTYLQYNNVILDFGLRPKNDVQLVPDIFKREVMASPNFVYLLFDQVAKGIDGIKDGRMKKEEATIKARLQYPNETVISGFIIREIIFSAKVKKIHQRVQIPAVFVYEEPKLNSLSQEAIVEKIDLGASEIVQSEDNVKVCIDFSAIKIPPNSQFSHVSFDFKRPVRMKSFEPLGLDKISINVGRLRFLAHFC